jgi:hypothetical protein
MPKSLHKSVIVKRPVLLVSEVLAVAIVLRIIVIPKVFGHFVLEDYTVSRGPMLDAVVAKNMREESREGSTRSRAPRKHPFPIQEPLLIPSLTEQRTITSSFEREQRYH